MRKRKTVEGLKPTTANGLRLSFFVYRGTGKAVSFDRPQTKVWEDTLDIRRAWHLRHPRVTGDCFRHRM